MAKLTDTQAVLLSSASQRRSGSLYPLPPSITTKPAPLARAIEALIKRGLVSERETIDAQSVARTDGDVRYGFFVTSEGKAAIGVEAADDDQKELPAAPASPPAASRQTKAGLVLSLLQRDGGASLDELVAATGWLPHTTRAALTGLRKKGHAIDKAKVNGATRYSVAGAA